MTDESGRAKFKSLFSVSRETMERLDQFVELVLLESLSQNLIAKSTEHIFWQRHMIDSAQLLPLCSTTDGRWLDVGTGAGFPGIVLSLMTDATFLLVEPRKLRAQFLQRVVDELGLSSRVEVLQTRVEAVAARPLASITARAFAPLSQALRATLHLADQGTTWLLHKGRNAAAEVVEAQRAFEGNFETIPSMTAPDASIVRVRGLCGVRS